MRLWIIVVVTIASLVPLSHGAIAQQQPLPCISYLGVPVAYIPNTMLNDVGMATVDGYGNPIIIMNPNVLYQYSPLTQQFWFAHECAHHAMPPQMNSEVNADCWAVRALRQIGWMTNQADIQRMLYEISLLPGNIYTGHLPGPDRAANLYACLSS